MLQSQVVVEEEGDQLLVGQEGEAEEAGEVDHLQGWEVVVAEGEVAVPLCCLAEVEGEVVLVEVEVPRGLATEGQGELVEVRRDLEEKGEEVVEEAEVQEALG